MKKLATVVGAAILIAGSPVLSGPARAAGCSESSCEGLDAGTEGCQADALLLQEFDGEYGKVRLYKSAACGAAWAEETQTVENFDIDLAVQLFYVTPLGGAEHERYKAFGQSLATYRTTMTSWRNSVKACDGKGYELDHDRFAIAAPTGADPDTGGVGDPEGVCGEWF